MVDGACSCGKGELRSPHAILLFSVAIIHLVRAWRGASCLLPRAPGARSSQLKVTKTRTNGRPKRTGAHLRAMEATRPAGDRWGGPGSVLRLSWPPPSPDAPANTRARTAPNARKTHNWLWCVFFSPVTKHLPSVAAMAIWRWAPPQPEARCSCVVLSQALWDAANPSPFCARCPAHGRALVLCACGCVWCA